MKTGIDYNCIKLDRKSAEPLHIQLKNALVREIRSLPPNKTFSMMSERELALLLNLSRPTTHRAYADLMADGLVKRKADKSLLVCSDARRKLSGSYKAIGVLLPMEFAAYIDNNNRNALPYLKGLIGRCSALNISCMMFRLPEAGSTPEQIDAFAKEHFGRLCGIIHLGDYPGDTESGVLDRLMRHNEIPQICISGTAAYEHIGSVYANAETGLKELCQTLKKQGFRRAGVVGRKQRFYSTSFHYVAIDRNRQMKEALETAGLQCCCVHDFPRDSYCGDLRSFLASPERPEVLLCHNDIIAGDVIRIAGELGLSVPGDLAVAGFDHRENSTFLASICNYPQKVAELAVDKLLEYFENGMTPENRICKINTDFYNAPSIIKNT